MLTRAENHRVLDSMPRVADADDAADKLGEGGVGLQLGALQFVGDYGRCLLHSEEPVGGVVGQACEALQRDVRRGEEHLDALEHLHDRVGPRTVYVPQMEHRISGCRPQVVQLLNCLVRASQRADIAHACAAPFHHIGKIRGRGCEVMQLPIDRIAVLHQRCEVLCRTQAGDVLQVVWQTVREHKLPREADIVCKELVKELLAERARAERAVPALGWFGSTR